MGHMGKLWSETFLTSIFLVFFILFNNFKFLLLLSYNFHQKKYIWPRIEFFFNFCQNFYNKPQTLKKILNFCQKQTRSGLLNLVKNRPDLAITNTAQFGRKFVFGKTSISHQSLDLKNNMSSSNLNFDVCKKTNFDQVDQIDLFFFNFLVKFLIFAQKFRFWLLLIGDFPNFTHNLNRNNRFMGGSWDWL